MITKKSNAINLRTEDIINDGEWPLGKPAAIKKPGLWQRFCKDPANNLLEAAKTIIFVTGALTWLALIFYFCTHRVMLDVYNITEVVEQKAEKALAKIVPAKKNVPLAAKGDKGLQK